MAEFIEYENGLRKADEGVELACLGAAAAVGAFGFVDTGDGDGNCDLLFYVRFEEEMGVGFFHIAIDKLNPFQGQRQIGGNSGLPRPSLAAGN